MRERTTQRTDSTLVLAAMRDLTRLELVTENIRAALEEVARTADHPLTGLVDDDWGRRYVRPVRLGKNPTRPKTRTLAAREALFRARAGSAARRNRPAQSSSPGLSRRSTLPRPCSSSSRSRQLLASQEHGDVAAAFISRLSLPKIPGPAIGDTRLMTRAVPKCQLFR
ncbi:hypothetical protein ACFYO0_10365 [Streptomyces sp. NPDC006365]|uniref:hypothetical protein n=1 Tax=Streptomyces sp. NPDC006365 TaxID=3364744 RepID=UPI0036B7C2C0